MDATFNSYHRSGWWHSHWLAYVLRIYWKSKESQSRSTLRRSEFLGTKFQRKHGFHVRQLMRECIGICRDINLFSVQLDSLPSAEIRRHYTQYRSMMLRPKKILILRLLSSFYFRSGRWQSAVLYISSTVLHKLYIHIYMKATARLLIIAISELNFESVWFWVTLHMCTRCFWIAS